MGASLIYMPTEQKINGIGDNDPSRRAAVLNELLAEFDRLGDHKEGCVFNDHSVEQMLNQIVELREYEPLAPSGPEPQFNGVGKANGRHHTKGRAIKTGDGYFVRTPLDAAVDPKLSHMEFRLLSLLTILCGQKDHCWHSEEWLANELPGTAGKKGVSVKTIQRGVNQLVELGYIEIIPADQLKDRRYAHSTPGNTYRLTSVIRQK